MMNPENKPLRIATWSNDRQPSLLGTHAKIHLDTYVLVLSNLAIAESNLVRAGKDSALPHFLAIVKELGRVCAFKFEISDDGT